MGAGWLQASLPDPPEPPHLIFQRQSFKRLLRIRLRLGLHLGR